MKKIILAAAIASVLAPLSAAVADTKLYGALRTSYVNGEKGTADIGGLENNASRIGIKGSYGDEGGLTGFFNIQGGTQTDNGGSNFTSRFAFAGVKGGFGKVVAGRLSHPYKMAGLKVDPFYDTSAGPTAGGSNYGLSSHTNGFTNNSIGYVSPKLGGAVTLNVLGIFNKNDNVNGVSTSPTTGLANNGTAINEDAVNIGATYSKSGLTASVQHITEIEATRVTLGYKAGALGAGISYEDVTNDHTAAVDDYTQVYVAGTYKVAPKTTLAASFGQVDDNGTGARNSAGDGFTLGVFQKVAPKTTVTAMYSEVDYDSALVGDRDVFAVGLIQKF